MFKLKLKKEFVVLIYMKELKNLLKLNVAIKYVINVINN